MLAWLLEWRRERDNRGELQWYGLCGWFERGARGWDWHPRIEWHWSVYVRPIEQKDSSPEVCKGVDTPRPSV